MICKLTHLFAKECYAFPLVIINQLCPLLWVCGRWPRAMAAKIEYNTFIVGKQQLLLLLTSYITASYTTQTSGIHICPLSTSHTLQFASKSVTIFQKIWYSYTCIYIPRSHWWRCWGGNWSEGQSQGQSWGRHWKWRRSHIRGNWGGLLGPLETPRLPEDMQWLPLHLAMSQSTVVE